MVADQTTARRNQVLTLCNSPSNCHFSLKSGQNIPLIFGVTLFQTMVCIYLPTMVPQPWLVTNRISQPLRAKQPLSFYIDERQITDRTSTMNANIFCFSFYGFLLLSPQV
ncbi:hypothetical protein L873DRAFT_467188 [Choiromyces venosus 120613-1]|uniref:Uncharacterized protein n=1 Tax=Choiromyces venosus 120613-1 TaxID=1336337 RepID=A0A3N4J1G1_9PEZI|nr:hypothetical protein L873DRAFT_467188 [Choiromyces venosus 120613-1]